MSLLSPTLEAFLAVARLRTVHAAARELGLTQTGVTQRLRALEAQLGATLFTRSRRGMRLTAEGEALLRYGQAARELEGPVLSRIERGGHDSEVRICLTGPTSILASRVVPQCVPVLKKFPRLFLTFNVVDIENRLNDLREGIAQLAVVPRSQVGREMDSKLLRPERYFLVGTPEWKGRRLKDIVAKEPIIDFDPTDRMTHAYLESIDLREKALAVRHFVNSNAALVHMFSGGLGYGVLTAEVARPYLSSGELILLHSGGGLVNEPALVWYPRPQAPVYFSSLVAAIK